MDIPPNERIAFPSHAQRKRCKQVMVIRVLSISDQSILIEGFWERHVFALMNKLYPSFNNNFVYFSHNLLVKLRKGNPIAVRGFLLVRVDEDQLTKLPEVIIIIMKLYFSN